MDYPVKKNETLRLTIDSVAYGGKGVARIDGYVIFVKNALPGQELGVKIIKRKRSYAEAIVLSLVKQSEKVIEAPCPWFSDCGGCTFQNLPYDEQLKIKKQQVEDVYRHLTHIGAVNILEPLPSPQIWGYRNKMEFSAGNARWIRKENDDGSNRDFAVGLHAPGRWDKILDIEECLLQDEDRNKIYKFIRNYIKNNNITLNNPREHKGFLRNIMIRKGEHSGEIMVNLITRTYDKALMEDLASQLIKEFPLISSIVNNVTASKGMQSRGEAEFLIHGSPVIHDNIGGIDYEISPNAFFQTNTTGAEHLYNVVKKYVLKIQNTHSEEFPLQHLSTKPQNRHTAIASQHNTSPPVTSHPSPIISSLSPLHGPLSPVIWDFYSGTGSIALYLAKYARKVYGFELISDAVKNANANARKNDLDNCEFFEADLDKFLQKNQQLIQSLDPPDIAVIDPPRAGIHPKFLQQLVELNPPAIIYVSCNPSTQARDVEAFITAGYQVTELQPVDMFPHTWHIESVALLQFSI